MLTEFDLFETGTLTATSGVVQAFGSSTFGVAALQAMLECHVRGLWGDIPEDDIAANDDAVMMGGRILSVYSFAETTDDVPPELLDAIPAMSDLRLWVITDADRTVTTILFPSEY